MFVLYRREKLRWKGASDHEDQKRLFQAHYAPLNYNVSVFWKNMICSQTFICTRSYRHTSGNLSTLQVTIFTLKSFGDILVNELLMRCKMLITDYSSVSWDVLYQNKPTLFYQFDLDKYNEAHGSYIDMKTDLFGDRAETLDQLLDSLEKTIQNNFRMEPKYEKMQQEYFQFEDHEHSRHICEEIKKWMKRK